MSIFTVFPEDKGFMPSDFETYKQAKKYAEWLLKNFGVKSTIESAC